MAIRTSGGLALALAAVGLAQDGAKLDRPAVVKEIVRLTNAEREKHKLTPLKVSDLLTKAAQGHADNMAAQKKMAHELDGKSAADRIKAVGYPYVTCAENVAFGQKDAAAVVAGWMDSPGHRANILSVDLTEIGVGVATDADGQPYYAQNFGKPLPAVGIVPLAEIEARRKSFATDIVKLLNAERTKAGKPAFKNGGPVTKAAQAHAESMAKADAMADGFKAIDALAQGGYPLQSAQEAIAAGPDDAKALVAVWMKGNQREAVLGDVPDLGVGVAFGAKGTAYVSVIFAKPR